MMAAAERIFEFLEEPEEVVTTKGNIDTSKLEGNVQFEHVKFGYNPEKTIIKDFNANVKEGQKIAIVGPTGAGKTTMVKLLMRFYELNGGEILLDGTNIKDYRRKEYETVLDGYIVCFLPKLDRNNGSVGTEGSSFDCERGPKGSGMYFNVPICREQYDGGYRIRPRRRGECYFRMFL